MQLPDFLHEVEPGEIQFVGHRINLYHVMRLHHEGYTPDMLHEQLPTLSPELIRQVLAFYRANQAEVDQYVAAYRADLERLEADISKHVDIEELMRRRPDIVRRLRP
jgi:uncharacterized protein (DUF433 family)